MQTVDELGSGAPRGGNGHPAASWERALRAYEPVTAATEAADLATLLRVVCRQAAEALDVTRCSVYLRRTDGRYQGQVGHSPTENITPRVQRHVAGADLDALTAQVLERGGPAAGTRHDQTMVGVRKAMQRWGSVDILAVPMVIDGDVIGILYLDDHGAPRVYSDQDERLASSFARLCAPAVRQTWSAALRGPSERDYEQLYAAGRRADQVAGSVAQALTDGLDLHRMLEVAAQGLGASLSVYRPDLTPVTHAVPPPPVRAPDPVLPSSAAALPWLQERLAELESHELVQLAATPHTRFRRLWVPLRRRGQLLGYAELAESPRRFGLGDREALAKLVGPLSVGLDRLLQRARADGASDAGLPRTWPSPLLAAAATRRAHEEATALLGPLLNGDAATAELLRTLVTFVATSSSYTRTAQALAIHVNSVRYRLGRVESLTGVHPADTRSIAQAVLALELLDLIEPVRAM